MAKLPRVNASQMIRALRRGEFGDDYQEGGHLTLRHVVTGRRVTVPRHSGDLSVRLIHKILKQAGLTPDRFRELLR